MSSDRRPLRAAARERAAVTVVLPTPPFPATMTRRDAAKNCAGSTVNPSERALRRLPRWGAIGGILLVLLAAPAQAQTPSSESPASGAPPAGAATNGEATVVQGGGYLDPINISFIEQAISDAERNHDQALIIQLDSPGAVVSDARLDQLLDRVRHASVPIAVWV